MRENKQNGCALCGSDNELKQSHIIPKLIYKRIKSHPKSRFRMYGNPKHLFNDGDKVPMLCGDCEIFMSGYETYFANYMLDPYLADEKVKVRDMSKIINLISMINWRVLYDDLYLFNSIKKIDETFHDGFTELEKKLKTHLLLLKDGKNPKLPDEILNEVYNLEFLKFNRDAINYYGNFIFAYSYYDYLSSSFTIVSHFAGFVMTTSYHHKNLFLINTDLNRTEILKQIRFPQYAIQQELVKKYEYILSLKEENDRVLSEGLSDKIHNYLSK